MYIVWNMAAMKPRFKLLFCKDSHKIKKQPLFLQILPNIENKKGHLWLHKCPYLIYMWK